MCKQCDNNTFLPSPADSAQVAVLDATNSTQDRRNLLRDRFHGRWQYVFIESICNDPVVLERNYMWKMIYSPDYKDMDREAAWKVG